MTEIAKTTASPATEPARPPVVYVYGGVWEIGSTGQLIRWALGTTDEGFVAAGVSYRPRHEAPFLAQIEDVYEGIDWLMDRVYEFGIDTDAVAVVGHSAGAHLALLAVLSDGGFGRRTDINVAVGVSGVYGLRVDDHEHAGESLSLFEDRPSAAELYRYSPITRIDDDANADADASSTPLPHGSEDPVVVPDQSTRLADTLGRAGTQVEYDAVDVADHVSLRLLYHYPMMRKRVFSSLRELL